MTEYKDLQQAVSLAARTAAVAGSAVVNLLNALNFGAALLDQYGTIIHPNAIAKSLFGSEIQVIRGRLAATDPAGNAELQCLIDAAITLPLSPMAKLPVTIRRKQGRPLVVESVPAAAGFGDPLSPLRAILLLTDLGDIPEFDVERLRAVFRLTNAEARLAVHVAEGKDLDGASETLGIAKETARSQLKSIFSKTGTHRQFELVALLARLGEGSGGKRPRGA